MPLATRPSKRREFYLSTAAKLLGCVVLFSWLSWANAHRYRSDRDSNLNEQLVVLNRYIAPSTETSTGEDAEQPHKIPHRLIFTYKWNIIEKGHPEKFHRNVLHTIKRYRKVWKDIGDTQSILTTTDNDVMFLDDNKCREELSSVEPALLRYFDFERNGSYKADICRVVVLYKYGGYFSDIDMAVINPYVAPPDVEFVTARDAPRKAFFQSFLAAAPGNVILNHTFTFMKRYYTSNSISGKLGPETLKSAFEDLTQVQRGNHVILQEINLEENSSWYPEIPRHESDGCCCNYIVEDSSQKIPHFFSRIVGAGDNCPW